MRARWRRTPANRSAIGVMALVLGLHVAASALVDAPRAEAPHLALLGLAYFVFGLFGAFALQSARSKLQRVNELLKAGDADLIAVHQLAAAFGASAQGELRGAIDRHLQDQIDYRLEDFDRSTASFLALFARVRRLEPRSVAQQIAYDHLLAVLIAAGERRKQVEALVRQRVSAVEWVALLAILGALWGLTLASGGEPIGVDVLAGVVVASLAGLMVILRHLDTLRWQEADAIWSPLHTLFLSLELLPYYPRVVVRGGRVDPPSGPIRLADYPRPYPDMRGKRVEAVEHRRGRP